MRALDWVGTLLSSVGMTLLVTSCAPFGSRVSGQDSGIHRPEVQRSGIVQLHFGRNASFGVCQEPACPRRTPKTVAPEIAQPTASVVPKVVEPGPGAGRDPEPLPRPIANKPEPPLVGRPPVSEPAVSPAALQPRGDGYERRAAAIPVSINSESAPIATPVSVISPSTKVRTEQLTLRFPFGSASLTPEAQKQIAGALESARRAERIVIRGRTDDVGPQEENDRFALARAIATRNYIRAQILNAPSVIMIDAHGRCCFVSDNDSIAGRVANHRVEVFFNLSS